jgi:flagellar biosynthetic protein FliR
MTVLLGDYPVVLLMVFFRVSGVLLVLPFFGIPAGSGWLLAGASLPLTLLFASVIPLSWRASAAALVTTGDLVLAIFGEVMLGSAIGAVCAIFVSAFLVAGSLASLGCSLSMAEELDPMTGESSDALAQLSRMLFLVTILALDAHLVIFRILARTFEQLPVPWVGWMQGGQDLALLGGTAFRAGVSIAMPIMLVSLIISIGMALVSRMASEFNILFLSLPFRLLLGLGVFALSILLSGGLLRSMAYQMLTSVTQFLGW